MGYKYEEFKQFVFTESGQLMFLKIRDRANNLFRQAGAARMGEIIKECTGSSWDMLACVDRLVEIGEIREVPQGEVAGQHRIFVSAKY